jgi:hypothetical protein
MAVMLVFYAVFFIQATFLIQNMINLGLLFIKAA